MNIKPTPSPHGSIAPPPHHLIAGWWRSYGRRWNCLGRCYLSTQDRKACLETPLRWLLPPSNHRMYQTRVMQGQVPEQPTNTGRPSRRERVCKYGEIRVMAESVKKKKQK